MSKIKVFFEKKNKVMVIAAMIFILIVIGFLMVLLFNQNKTKKPSYQDAELEITIAEDEETTTVEDEETTTFEIMSSQEETIPLEDVTVDEEIGDIDETVSLEEVTTKAQKELPYLIKLNRAANCITVYAKDAEGNYTVPYKAIVCSTGKRLGNTPLGEFKTLRSYEWLKMVGGVYSQFAYRFYGSILFHSVPYCSKSKDDLEYWEFNKLGEKASLGCVRICVRDAIWLVENCPVGTKVSVYDDADNPGPLGKPEMIKIPVDSPNRGWDPTDPDPNNPWHQCYPEIIVDETVSVEINKCSMENIVEAIGATAKDSCGNIITEKINTGGTVNFNKLGSYILELSVKDAIGKSVTKAVIIRVKEAEETTTQPQSTTSIPTQSATSAKPTQSTTNAPTQSMPVEDSSESTTTIPSTDEIPETTAKTVRLQLSTTEIKVIAGQYTDLKTALKENMICTALYSDGTIRNNITDGLRMLYGKVDFSKAGKYEIMICYSDSQNLTSAPEKMTIEVLEKNPVLNAKVTRLEVTTGEYLNQDGSANVLGILTMFGLSAVDSKGNEMDHVANLVAKNLEERGIQLDLVTLQEQELVLQVTDEYGMKSNEITVVIRVMDETMVQN